MERSSFFNSINNDRRYKAQDWAEYFASFIGNGVFPLPSTGLQIIAGNGMEVIVSSGRAWINGYFYMNDADLALPLSVADGVLKRINRVVLRWDLTERSITAKIKQGTPSTNPTPQPLQRDADIFELALADVLVNNGVTAITQGNITDNRFNSSLCGLATGLVQQIDFDVLTAQFNDFIGSFKNVTMSDFLEWYDIIKDTLDEDTAGHLLLLIQGLQEETQAHISNHENTVQDTVLTNYALGSNINIAATDEIAEAFGKLQAQLTQPTNAEVDAGTVQERRGWSPLQVARAARNTLLTGYAVGSNAAVAATDRVLAAIGKLQAQVNNRIPTSRPSDNTSVTWHGTWSGQWCRYWRMGALVVGYFAGVRSGTFSASANVDLFTLPSGFRPYTDAIYSCIVGDALHIFHTTITTGGIARVAVATNASSATRSIYGSFAFIAPN